MLNQPCQPEMMQSPPLHYTQSLDEATQDFQDLILARNVPRVSQSLNPHANEFQATQVITQASNNTTSPTTQPIAQALNNTTRPAPQSNASFANVTMYDVAYRLERLEAEVSELRLELQEHVESPTSRNKNGKSERDMREAKLLEKMMLQQPVPLKHTEQFDDRAGLGTMVEDSNQLEHPKQFNDRAALGAMVGESRQVHNDAGSDDLIML